MKFHIPTKDINWVTSTFLSVTLLLTLTAVPAYIWLFGVDAFQIGMFLFYVMATGFSITLGYHRLFSHLSFKAKWPVRAFVAVFGAATFQNSIFEWVSDHRRHHKHVDHDEDPYDISKGFFWAHIGWLLFKTSPKPPFDNIPDLMKDPLCVWQHKHCHYIGAVVGFVTPLVIGMIYGAISGVGWWEAGLGGLLLAGVARVTIVQQCTFFINSLCHSIGSQPFSTESSARDSWLMAIFTFGEGYHNYHHTFQHDYRNGVKPWHFDPTKWIIWTLSKLGLASSLREVAAEKIAMAELLEAQRKINKKLETHTSVGEGLLSHVPESMRQNYVGALESLRTMSETLNEKYGEAQKSMEEKLEVSREKIAEWQATVREAMDHLREFRQFDVVPSPA